MDYQNQIKNLVSGGLTQAGIAAQIGISQNGVWKLLHGKTKIPNAEIAAKLLALHRREMKKMKG